MAAPIPLRSNFTAELLRAEANWTRDAKQARRLLAFAAIYDGDSRGDAARIGGVGLQVVRHWVLWFNAVCPDGLIDRKAPSVSPKLNDDRCRVLDALVERGPNPALHGVVRWWFADLAQFEWKEFRIPISPQTLRRELHRHTYRRLSARPRHHGQDPHSLETQNIIPPRQQRSRMASPRANA